MKVKCECGRCGSTTRKYTVNIRPEDRDAFLVFTEMYQQQGDKGIIPPSKYPKNPILIPSPGENPCKHCKFGEELVGPNGCGRGLVCIPYKYWQLYVLSATTPPDTTRALKEFTCGAPSASWIAPTSKKSAARSVAVNFPFPPATTSRVPGKLQKKNVVRRSKWQKPSRPRSKRKNKRSLKRR